MTTDGDLGLELRNRGVLRITEGTIGKVSPGGKEVVLESEVKLFALDELGIDCVELDEGATEDGAVIEDLRRAPPSNSTLSLLSSSLKSYKLLEGAPSKLEGVTGDCEFVRDCLEVEGVVVEGDKSLAIPIEEVDVAEVLANDEICALI